MTAYGLVLSGGGAMGSYEIGVWQAIKDLNIQISGIAGTSVGAINGAMMLQGDFEKALNLWRNITVDQIIEVESMDLNKPLLKWAIKDFNNFLQLFKNFIKQKGLDTTPLRHLLQDVIDEDLIRKSNIDFGINTYSLGDKKLNELYLDQIPQGELIDYLMASACLPIFKKIEINNKKFVDGGLYDNVPINLLSKKGYENLIVVELLPSIIKPNNIEDLNIIRIKSSISLGGIMEFNPENAKKNIALGYLDAMKVLKKNRREKPSYPIKKQ